MDDNGDRPANHTWYVRGRKAVVLGAKGAKGAKPIGRAPYHG